MLYLPLFALITTWWLVPIAYAQQGYHAIGGEWVLVLTLAFVAFQVGKFLSDKITLDK